MTLSLRLIVEALGPIITPPNPMMVLVVSYEYLFCHPSSDRLWPPGDGRLTVMTQQLGYDRFPPVAK
jgi:hypothetical protein